jgi:hypothetical protein
MAVQRRRTNAEFERVFGPAGLRYLQNEFGSAAAQLIPAFADAATRYRDLERETESEGRKRRKIAGSHVLAARRLERQISQLIGELDSAGARLGDAAIRGYLSVPPASGTIGQLGAAAAIEGDIAALRRAAATIADHARFWRDRAEADAKLKRGRKTGDRLYLAEWVAMRLQGAGLRVTKTKQGFFERILTIVYDAAGVPVPEDLARDVKAAVDHVRRKVR